MGAGRTKKRWTFEKWKQNCFDHDWCECPNCPEQEHCMNEDNIDGECGKEVCPTWKNRNKE